MTDLASRAKPGDLFQHTETGTVAAFREYRRDLFGNWLLVLHHHKFGECRWAPCRARPYDPASHGPDPHHH
jgi:hypothetical protein